MSKQSRLNKARQEKQEAREKEERGANKNTGEQRPTQKDGNQGAPEKRGGRES
jgi:hypothetical protein